MFGLDLVGRRDFSEDALDRVHFAFDHTLDAERQRHALLRRDGIIANRRRGARLLGRFSRHRHDGAAAQCPRKLKCADTGAASSPAAFLYAFIEVRTRQAEHAGNIVDRRQRLLVQPLRFSEQFRCDLLLGDHGEPPQRKSAGIVAGARLIRCTRV